MSRLLVVAALVCAGTAQAQTPWHVSAGLAGTREIINSRAGAVDARLTGTVFSGEALVARRHVVGRLRYGQGRVSDETVSRDVALGEVLLGYEAREWLTLWVGPQARTFTAPGLSDRRWLFWTARVSARGGIFPGKLDGVGEVWRGFGGRLSRPEVAASGGGVEFGLEARPFARPFGARLAYRIEQGRATGGFRETVEGFTLTLSYRR
ncbi:MAG: hypothetical protein ABR537_10955 [Gemmatimonadales bacterium]